MAKERILPIRLTVKSLESIRGLEIDNECMPIRRRSDGLIELQALASESTVARLRRMRKRDVFVEVLEDRIDEAASTKKLVSQTNRYAGGSVPRGQGSRRR